MFSMFFKCKYRVKLLNVLEYLYVCACVCVFFNINFYCGQIKLDHLIIDINIVIGRRLWFYISLYIHYTIHTCIIYDSIRKLHLNIHSSMNWKRCNTMYINSMFLVRFNIIFCQFHCSVLPQSIFQLLQQKQFLRPNRRSCLLKFFRFFFC